MFSQRAVDVRNWFPWLGMMGVAFLLIGCDHSPFDRTGRGMDQGEQKEAARDYRGAINSYEQALDGTAKTSEAHFRLALIYANKLNEKGAAQPDEKRNNQINAVHHFRRYMDLSPNGAHVGEAKAALGRLELTLATDLAGGTLISHTEAMRIKADNADLKRQLAVARSVAPPTPPPGLAPAGTNASAAGKLAARDAQLKPPPGTRTYQVQPGDTLASISRKFYKTKVRAKDIQDANLNSVPDAAKLKTGQTLIIP